MLMKVAGVNAALWCFMMVSIGCGTDPSTDAAIKERYIYSLSEFGYNNDLRIMLFSKYTLKGDALVKNVLGLFDMQAGRATYYPIPDELVMWAAWRPGSHDIAVMHGFDLFSILVRNAETGTYAREVIHCPGDTVYHHCRWSPGGSTLAVACVDVMGSRHENRLGLYRAADKKFTNVETDGDTTQRVRVPDASDEDTQIERATSGQTPTEQAATE